MRCTPKAEQHALGLCLTGHHCCPFLSKDLSQKTACLLSERLSVIEIHQNDKPGSLQGSQVSRLCEEPGLLESLTKALWMVSPLFPSLLVEMI